MIALPAQLQQVIRHTLHQYPSQLWSEAARQLSERYRAARDGSPLVQSPLDAFAYAAMLMPATYAQLYRALQISLARHDTSHWHSLLDLGSGPGTALWALHTLVPTVTERTAIERDSNFIAIARTLCAPLLGHTTFVAHDITHAAPWSTHDVVIIGHVLNELTVTQRAQVIANAWAATQHMLIIVEPGTSAFFDIIKEARRQLLDLGAQVVAPCTHNAPCPMVESDWCHFGQKIARPDFQRQARAVQIGWEEAKVSFVAVTKQPTPQAGQRIIHDPIVQKGAITLPVCGNDGLHTPSIRKRDKTAYAKARRAAWGDIWDDATNEV